MPVNIKPKLSIKVDLPTPGTPDIPSRMEFPAHGSRSCNNALALARWSPRVLGWLLEQRRFRQVSAERVALERWPAGTVGLLVLMLVVFTTMAVLVMLTGLKVSAAAMLAVPAMAGKPSAVGESQPNIIFILADDLGVHLAGSRHVDAQVAVDHRLAGQTAGFTDLRQFRVFRLPCRRKVVRIRDQVFLGETAGNRIHAATAAQGPSAADRVDVHAELPSRLQHGGAAREPAALARRAENDECVRAARHDDRSAAAPAAAPASSTRPPRFAVRRDPGPALLVVAHDHVGGAHGLHQGRLQRVGDRG